LGDNSTETSGTARCKIAIGDAAYFGEFWVCNYDVVPRFQIILGMDFLARAVITINTPRRLLMLPNDYTVPMTPGIYAHEKRIDIPIRTHE
jgi:hypothetical protein